jgi:hypothetical protein
MNNDPRQQDGSRRNTRASDGDDQEVYWKKEVDADPYSSTADKVDSLTYFLPCFLPSSPERLCPG